MAGAVQRESIRRPASFSAVAGIFGHLLGFGTKFGTELYPILSELVARGPFVAVFASRRFE
jgi:hypothetical protein